MTKTENSVAVFSCPLCGTYGNKEVIATFYRHLNNINSTPDSHSDSAGKLFKCLNCQEIFRH